MFIGKKKRNIIVGKRTKNKNVKTFNQNLLAGMKTGHSRANLPLTL